MHYVAIAMLVAEEKFAMTCTHTKCVCVASAVGRSVAAFVINPVVARNVFLQQKY
jgi:hypothetical protein